MEWIKVTDRLPEQDEYVLVLVEMNELYSKYMVGWYDYGYGFKFNELGKDINGIKATHWMPLPEPPKV
jgi:hypothetical protein